MKPRIHAGPGARDRQIPGLFDHGAHQPADRRSTGWHSASAGVAKLLAQMSVTSSESGFPAFGHSDFGITAFGLSESGPSESGLSGAGDADAADLERALRLLGTPERAANEKAYLKSDLEFAGVPVPAIRAQVALWCKNCGGLSHDRLTAMTRALWSSSLYESRQSAVLLLARNTKLLGLGDAELIEYLLRNSGTWALVDGLAANVAGALAERFEGMGSTLDRWAADADFWIRRSALLALLGPLRRGEGDFERFAGYADAMLEDKEFFIRKAIGWVLREVAKRRPDLVASWLGPRVQRASGVTVREAVKPLPPQIRERLLAGYRARQPVYLR